MTRNVSYDIGSGIVSWQMSHMTLHALGDPNKNPKETENRKMTKQVNT